LHSKNYSNSFSLIIFTSGNFSKSSQLCSHYFG